MNTFGITASATKAHMYATAGDLTNVDSLILVYIAFLAYDAYVASHGMQSQIGLRGGEASDSPTIAVDKTSGIAHTIIDDLIKEAGIFVEDPEYSEVRTATGNIVRELYAAICYTL